MTLDPADKNKIGEQTQEKSNEIFLLRQSVTGVYSDWDRNSPAWPQTQFSYLNVPDDGITDMTPHTPQEDFTQG